MKKNHSYIFIVLLVLEACVYHDVRPKVSGDYFVFGSFYGMCVGKCVHVFIIHDRELYQVNNTAYPNKSRSISTADLTKLDQEQYDLVKTLPDSLPPQLLTESNTTIGCPDCADGGGLYIETKVNGEKRFWYLDNSKYQTPQYLHGFIDEANAKIRLLVK